MEPFKLMTGEIIDLDAITLIRNLRYSDRVHVGNREYAHGFYFQIDCKLHEKPLNIFCGDAMNQMEDEKLAHEIRNHLYDKWFHYSNYGSD